MEQSFSMIEWSSVPVKHFSTSKVKANGSHHLSVNNYQVTTEAKWDTHTATNSVTNTHTHIHAHNPIMSASYLSQVIYLLLLLLLSLSDKLNMWISLNEKQHEEKEWWKKLLAVCQWNTYPLLLCGYKSLEAGGHAEAQLVNEWGLRLAVDLHPHTCLEGCVL